MPQIVKTFPQYQLKNFSNDMDFLGLMTVSCLDTYELDKNTWATHSIVSVHTVECNQRLLYCLCCSVTEVVTHCPGLEEEL